MKVLSDLSFDKPSFLVIAYGSLHEAVSAYGIGKEGQKRSVLPIACLLPVAS